MMLGLKTLQMQDCSSAFAGNIFRKGGIELRVKRLDPLDLRYPKYKKLRLVSCLRAIFMGSGSSRLNTLKLELS